MKYLKLFDAWEYNTPCDLSQENIDDIKDLFQDIKDEFDLEESSIIGGYDSNRYSIIHQQYSINRYVSQPRIIAIEIAIIMNNKIWGEYNRTEFDSSLNDFKMRLDLAGYVYREHSCENKLPIGFSEVFMFSITKK